MDRVTAFLDDGEANSENFRSEGAATADSCTILVGGYYHFTLSLGANSGYLFTAGAGCSPSSKAIKMIVSEANGKRPASKGDAVKDALLALRDAYLKYSDNLDEEAQEEEGGEDDDDAAAEAEAIAQDRENERLRKEIEDQKRFALEKLSPEERKKKELIEAYIKQLRETNQAGDLPPTATMRILTDLARVKSTESLERGWTAEPMEGQLRKWIVKLNKFDKGCKLDQDMDSYARKSGREKAIIIEMIMDREYPHRPPFVRVVRPQFMFRTGHVTLGGAICMLPLTDQGWNPSFEIESIIEMCRANILDEESGARIDMDKVGGDYNVAEAQDGFRRLVATHGWTHRFNF